CSRLVAVLSDVVSVGAQRIEELVECCAHHVTAAWSPRPVAVAIRCEWLSVLVGLVCCSWVVSAGSPAKTRPSLFLGPSGPVSFLAACAQTGQLQPLVVGRSGVAGARLPLGFGQLPMRVDLVAEFLFECGTGSSGALCAVRGFSPGRVRGDT